MSTRPPGEADVRRGRASRRVDFDILAEVNRPAADAHTDIVALDAGALCVDIGFINVEADAALRGPDDVAVARGRAIEL